MFDPTDGRNLLNPGCRIYREIAKIADVMRNQEPLRFGRMYYREISGDGLSFGLPFGSAYTLAFSRMLYPREVLVAYNISDRTRRDRVIVDASLHPDDSQMQFLYGGVGVVKVQTAPSHARYIELELDPHQFSILS
jgi:alpha-amylase